MTELLVKLFVKNPNETDRADVRASYGRLAGIVGILCNLFLCAGKLLVGTLSGSISITADAVNNLSDASSSIISLIGFKMASKPADEDHPYGHARYEYLSGLFVSVVIMVIGINLLRESIAKIAHPTEVTFSYISIAVLAASILVKLWMALFNTTLGKRICSETLIATAQDSRNDVISTSAVILAALLSHFLSVNLDGYIGAAVALFILYSGFNLIKDTLDPILGKAPAPELVSELETLILSYPGILGIHDLIVHDYGPCNQFASVHAEVPAEGDMLELHDMIDNIEVACKQKFGIQLVIHMDPVVTADERIVALRQTLSEKIAEIDPRLTIHDFRMVPGTTHTNLVFDCAVPHGLSMPAEELKRKISEAAWELDKSYCCVVTVENSFAAISK